MMPEGMSGRELAEKIVAEEPELRVMLTSGYPMEAIGNDVAKAGFCFLQKPYSPGVLAQAVRECLDNGKPKKRSSQPQTVQTN
jgi:two-component system, cell cycle sensor histidine kinase and response regulator CckA